MPRINYRRYTDTEKELIRGGRFLRFMLFCLKLWSQKVEREKNLRTINNLFAPEEACLVYWQLIMFEIKESEEATVLHLIRSGVIITDSNCSWKIFLHETDQPTKQNEQTNYVHNACRRNKGIDERKATFCRNRIVSQIPTESLKTVQQIASMSFWSAAKHVFILPFKSKGK